MNEKLTIDMDIHNLRNSASTILHLLDDFIPPACRQDAQYRLLQAFDKDGIELTSKLMRKQYEAWKELSLDSLEIANHIFKVAKS